MAKAHTKVHTVQQDFPKPSLFGKVEVEVTDGAMTTEENGAQVRTWACLDAGLYRFQGTDLDGGFFADARLQYRGVWCVTIEQTNYRGDIDWLADTIAAYAEEM